MFFLLFRVNALPKLYKWLWKRPCNGNQFE